jgi:hypothetical protein
MKAKSKLLTVVVAVFILMSFLGCSNKEDESPEGQALESDSGRQKKNRGHVMYLVIAMNSSRVIGLRNFGKSCVTKQKNPLFLELIETDQSRHPQSWHLSQPNEA